MRIVISNVRATGHDTFRAGSSGNLLDFAHLRFCHLLDFEHPLDIEHLLQRPSEARERPKEVDTVAEDQTRSFSKLRDASLSEPSAVPAGGLNPGSMLGRYTVLYRVGGGGMGEVYAAYDPQLDRREAIKVLRRGKESETTRRLQRREAKAMAQLRHRNVVTVHDVGELDEGLFLAMEFVDGPTISEWLAEQPRSWREVVEVFQQAGRGLAAVHRAGLVHQDFKPANAMLAPDDEVRLADFGLARPEVHADTVREPEEGPRPEGGAEPSLHSRLLGTPGYLAPERLEGEPTDARSDQFSFCVALYKALFGDQPFDSADVASYLEQVRGAKVREPATPPAVPVPGWLREVLLRGLSARAEDRYRSMEDLLQDLSPSRRSGRRKRLMMGVAAALVAAVTTFYLAVRPEAETLCGGAAEKLRGIWDAETKAAVRSAFGSTGLAIADPSFLSVERTLDTYAEDWVTMHTEACEATHVRGEQSERLLDLRMLCLDERLEEAHSLTRLLSQADADTVIQAVRSAQNLSPLSRCADRSALSELNLPTLNAAARKEMEDIRAAVEDQGMRYQLSKAVDPAVLDEGVETARRLGYGPLEARALQLKAEVNPDSTRAADLLKEALRVAIASRDRLRVAHLYGLILQEVGYHQGNIEEGELWRSFSEAALVSLDPGHGEVQYDMHMSLGVFGLSRGDFPDAASHYRRALEIGEKLWGPDDFRLANALNDLSLASKPEDPVESLALLRRALELKEKALGPLHPSLRWTLVNLGSRSVEMGDYEEALGYISRCRAVLEPDGIPYLALLTGQLYLFRDDPEAAIAAVEPALPTIRGKHDGQTHPILAMTLEAIGRARLLQLRPAEARRAFDDAREIRKNLPEGHPEHAFTLFFSGRCHLRTDDPRTALRELGKGLELAAAADYANMAERDVMMARMSLGEAAFRLGDRAQAKSHLDRVLASERVLKDPWMVGEARFILARLLWTEDPQRALEQARLAVEGLAAGRSPWSRKIHDEAEDWLQKKEVSAP